MDGVVNKRRTRLFLAVAGLAVLTAIIILAARFAARSPIVEDAPGPLVVAADPALMPYLPGFLADFAKLAGGRTLTFRPLPLGLPVLDPTADVYLVAGKRARDELLKQGAFSYPGERPFLYDSFEAAVRSSETLDLKLPIHLVQPATREIAVMPAGDPYASAIDEFLRQWDLTARLKNRLVAVKNVNEAVYRVRTGNLVVALIPRSERLRHPDLKAAVPVTRDPVFAIPFFALVPTKSPRIHAAAKLEETLRSTSMQKRFQASGFETTASLPLNP